MIDLFAPPPAMSAADLKAWAKRLGLSTAEAAAILGLSRRGYENQAYGHRPVSPQTARIAELAEKIRAE